MMQEMTKKTQESRTMSIGAKVTPSEYHRLSFVVGHRGTDVANLIRELVIEPMMDEHARLSEAMEKVA